MMQPKATVSQKMPCQLVKLRTALPDQRRENRNQNRDGHDHRNGLGHLPAFKTVANDGDRQDPRCRGTDPLGHAADDHGFEARRPNGNQAPDTEQPDAEQQDRLAAQAVGQRPEQHLRQRHAEHERPDDELAVVVVGGGEFLADQRQGGHDRVG